MDLLEAATKLQINAARGLTPELRLEALEVGSDQPSRPLLLKMAKLYRRSLLVFYLDAPPSRGNRGEDFRTLPAHPSIAQEGLVDSLVRDVKARQRIVRSALEEEDETTPLDLVASVKIEDGIPAIANAIRTKLGFRLETFRSQRAVSDAFTYLRNLVESSGIYVLLIGDLGSHHTAVSVDHFRGFALADPIAPFIVINDQDAKSAWSFTLLHELAHIFLGKEGISASVSEGGIERFCNEVAAALLIQDSDLINISVRSDTDIESAISEISDFADQNNISRSMVAYRLFIQNLINRDYWQRLQEEFRSIWLSSRARERESRRSSDGGGPNYYVVRRFRAGHALVGLVSRMTLSGSMTTIKAGRVLGVKPRNVFDLISLSR